MSVELIKKSINVFQTIDEQQKEELIETGMIVPDSKPDILDVLLVDADVVVKTREKTGRVMEVGGEINYQVIYRADNQEQSLEAINAKAPWSVSCSYPPREEDIYTLVRSNVEHTTVEVVNGRKLSAKSVVNLNVRYLIAQNIEAGEAVQGEQIYQKADRQEIAVLEDAGEKILDVSENMELPEGRPVMEEVLYSRAGLKNVALLDNMNLECILEVDFLYRADNDSSRIENVHMEIPVNRSLDVENNKFNDMSLNANVKSLAVKPDEDMDGMLTKVKIDAEIRVEYSLYSKEDVHLVKDAYAIDYDFELERKPVTVGVEERDIRDNIQVNGRLTLDNGGDTLEEVLSLTVKPRLLSAERDGASVEVNGCLDVCVLYATGVEMRILRGSNQEVPFTHRIPLPEPDASYENDINMSVDGNSYEITSDTELEIKTLVGIRGHLSKKRQIQVVTAVKGVKPCEKKENPPLLIYYTQKGDNLWDISKKYRVPMQKILNDNGMTEEAELEQGQKIFFVG